ncbi:MAG: ATP-dependent sacrificial sulfur transferase LarE [Sporolactobacillus sp.]
MTIDEKFTRLQTIIRKYGRLAVAFSGGVDSTFLLKAASDVLGEDALALTIASPTTTVDDAADISSFCREHAIRCIRITLDPMENPSFRSNSPRRCYYCKAMEFGAMRKAAAAHGILRLASGINAEDADDYRPGLKALAELEVVSPLKEAGLTKSDIRELSKRMGLRTWNKPANSCLASRIPYGEAVTADKLKKISAGERLLHDLHFRHVRVRLHQDMIARIEVAPEERRRFLEPDLMDEITAGFQSIGFRYTTLDLRGYRTGSLNELLDAATKREARPVGDES